VRISFGIEEPFPSTCTDPKEAKVLSGVILRTYSMAQDDTISSEDFDEWRSSD